MAGTEIKSGNTVRHFSTFTDREGNVRSDLDTVKFQVFNQGRVLVYEQLITDQLQSTEYYADYAFDVTPEARHAWIGFVGQKGTLVISKREPVIITF